MGKTRRRAARRRAKGEWPERWTREDAERVLAAWRASGLELSVWCRREGLGYERVRRWRGQLASHQPRVKKSVLLPVEVMGDSQTALAGAFELELAQGRRLRVPSDFDETALARLIRVVEDRA
jgi:hypothetical protein